MAVFSRMLTDNPIARAELTHQQRAVADHKMRRWTIIFGVALGVALLSTAALLFQPQLADLLNMPESELEDLLRGWFGTITLLMGALLMVQHLSFASAAIQIASTSIAREKQGRTWEALLLTGVDARRIVYGKWWGTMRTLLQAYRSLLLLRFIIALWIGAATGIAHMSLISYATPPLLNQLLISVATAVFPLGYAAFAATVGLLASLLVRSETAAYRVASLLHFGTVVISLSLVLVSLTLPFLPYEPGVAALIPALFVTPLDGGMLALIGIIAGDLTASTFYMLGLLICIVLYGGLTWAILRGTQSLAVRQRASPPP